MGIYINNPEPILMIAKSNSFDIDPQLLSAWNEAPQGSIANIKPSPMKKMDPRILCSHGTDKWTNGQLTTLSMGLSMEYIEIENNGSMSLRTMTFHRK